MKVDIETQIINNAQFSILMSALTSIKGCVLETGERTINGYTDNYIRIYREGATQSADAFIVYYCHMKGLQVSDLFSLIQDMCSAGLTNARV